MAKKRVYEAEVRHNGLNKYRHIRGTDRHVVEQKAAVQANAWEEMCNSTRSQLVNPGLSATSVRKHCQAPCRSDKIVFS